LEDLPDILSKEALDLYRIVQESLTNTARHSDAGHVQIIWKYSDHRLLLEILDNGKGFKEIHLGNGLIGMKDRVDRLGGSIDFSGERGFATRVQIPFQEK